MLSNIFFYNPLSRIVRGETLFWFTHDFYPFLAADNSFHFYFSWQLVGFAAVALFALAFCVWVVWYGSKELKRHGALFAAVFLGAAVKAAIVAGTKPPPTPPPIVVKDIEITNYKCDHTGLEIGWRHGTNVVYGTDKFIIQRATRQIPARTGWSAFTDFAETMTTNYVNNTPFHAEDNRFKVIVRKVAN